MIILYVDDDSDDLELFCEAVKEINPTAICLTANHGQEALKILSSDLFELPSFIFLDINMPIMDGISCLQAIRRDTKFDRVKVNMYSTSTEPRDAIAARKLNAGFISKPNKYDTLVMELSKII
jgi:CheY-like chemotaxis protein